MTIEKVQKDLKEAMRAGDKGRVSTLRFLLAAVHNRKFEKQALYLSGTGQADLVDEDILAVVRQQVKQHKESIAAYQQGKREDLVAKEQSELDILNTYLPQQMGDEALEKIVKDVIEEMGSVGPADFGKAMGAVMGKVKGLADGNQVAAVVKSQLLLL